MEFQFDFQNSLKQPKMWIFEKWKIIDLAKVMAFFGPVIWDSGISVHRHYVHGRWSRHVDQTDINMVWLSNMSNMYN